jgi:hypothetical protein
LLASDVVALSQPEYLSASGKGAGPVGIRPYLNHLVVLDGEHVIEALRWCRSGSFDMTGHAEAKYHRVSINLDVFHRSYGALSD